MDSRRVSPRAHTRRCRPPSATLTLDLGRRHSVYERRAATQVALLKLPAFPTTTIGSFPQTAEIRHARSEFKAGRLDQAGYELAMRAEIARSVRAQEALGLDVLVHGEAERNDMVEYFGASSSMAARSASSAGCSPTARAASSPPDPVRRHLAAEGDDGRVDPIRAVADRQGR